MAEGFITRRGGVGGVDLGPFFDTSGSPGSPLPIVDLDGNVMADETKGIAYYGTVSHADLFNANELASELGITIGDTTQRPINDVWHKYYWNGGIHFWRRPARNSVSWNVLANAGAIYGTGTTISRKGSLSNLVTVPQNAEITKNGITYIHRLMEGSTSLVSPLAQPNLVFGSEHNLILGNLHVATNSGSYSDSPTDGFTYLNWISSNFTNDDFVGWKTILNDPNFQVGSGDRASVKWNQEVSDSFTRNGFCRTGVLSNVSSRNLMRISDQDRDQSGDNMSWYPVLTVKHPSFATYGKTGGFNQNEPDW